MWDSGTLQINRLSMRRHGGTPDPLVSRMRLASRLQSANLQPAGLSPLAILCIRRLHDPMPGSLRLQPDMMEAPQMWEQALAVSLERLARSAARPARHAVPAAAEAIVFADRAEMLACLASDWCDGSLTEHWWWRSLFKGNAGRNMVINAWLDAPEYAPAALEHLVARGMAVPFIRKLGSSDTRNLLLAVTTGFALPGLAEIVAGIPDVVAPPPAETESAAADEAPAREPGEVPPERLLRTAPWRSWVAESSATELNPQQHCLLGIGLMLVRAPHVVHSSSFATAVREWSRVEPVAEKATVHVQSAAAGASIHEKADAAGPKQSSPASRSVPITVGNDDPAKPGVSDVEGHRFEYPQTAGSAASEAPAGHRHAVPHESTDGHCAEDSPGIIIPPTIPEQTASPQGGLTERAALLEASIMTELGGLFYLINLGLYLNLYGDFTCPLRPGISMSIWDFMALAGRHLLGGETGADPIWPLLAQLAGRSVTEEPGRDYEPPESWQMPPEWLTSFPEAECQKWSAGDGRLRVWHPAGFLLLDLPLDAGEPGEQLRRETEWYGPVVTFERESGAMAGYADTRSPLDRWLERLMPYLRARLQRALGLSEADNLPQLLCQQSARVSVTAAHVDVFFALDEHPVVIRLAGLDRNPGWLPAAGRFIAFHYE